MKKNESKLGTATITSIRIVNSSLTENSQYNQGSASFSNQGGFERTDFQKALRSASKRISQPVVKMK